MKWLLPVVVVLATHVATAQSPFVSAVESLVPARLRKLPIASFVERLEELDPEWTERVTRARARHHVLRYVASVTRRRIRVGLAEVSPGTPFAGLTGSDNQVVFTTQRYRSNPLVIQGPGAGLAVTAGPGLVGSLLVGVSTAKALAYTLQKPLAAVNHIEGHLYAVLLEHPQLEYPFVALVASGGHTHLYHAERPGVYRLLGATRDDAAGEAFDKVATLLGLPYPGGPHIERAARTGDPRTVPLPRPTILHQRRLPLRGHVAITALAGAQESRTTRSRADDDSRAGVSGAPPVAVRGGVEGAQARLIKVGATH